MPQEPDSPATSVLLIDGNDTDRTCFANHLKNCSPDYQIFEAIDGESGLALFRTKRIDCVVLALELAGRSGLQVLVE